MLVSEVLFEHYISDKDIMHIFKRAVELVDQTGKNKTSVGRIVTPTKKPITPDDSDEKLESLAHSDITHAISEGPFDRIKTLGGNLANKVTLDKLLKRWQKYGSDNDSAVVLAVLRNSDVPDEIISQLQKETTLGKDVSSDSDKGGINNGEQINKNRADGDIIKGDKEEAVDGIKTSMSYMSNWGKQGQDIGDNYNVTMKSIDNSESLSDDEKETAKGAVNQYAQATEFREKTELLYSQYQEAIRRVYQQDNEGEANSHGDPRMLAKFLLNRSTDFSKEEYLAMPDEEKARVDNLQAKIERLRKDFGNKTSGAKGDDLKYAIEKLWKKQPKIVKSDK
jgi:hypothetical protein